MSRDRVFNTRRTRLRRTRIPRSENVSVVVVFFALLLLIGWLATTRSAFDPGARDLPIELLGDNSRQIDIYNRPLKPWVEPGQQFTKAEFDLEPFPPPTLDSEWRPVARIKRFQSENLYEKINGEAEKFIKQGFVELAFLRLRSAEDASEIVIELFDQGDLGGSLGIFSEHLSGRAVEQRDGVSFFITRAGVIGRVGRFFFRIAGDRQSTAITGKANSLVTAFARLGGKVLTVSTDDQAAPAGFNLLNRRLGILESDIHFQESNVFQYDFAQRFWFGNAGLGNDARLFVHIADGVGEAEALVSALREEHSYEYDELEHDNDYRLFRHRYLHTYFVVAHRGRYVFGIEKLPDTTPMSALLDRISESLDDDES